MLEDVCTMLEQKTRSARAEGQLPARCLVNVRIIPVKDPSRVPSIGAAKMAMEALTGIPETP